MGRQVRTDFQVAKRGSLILYEDWLPGVSRLEWPSRPHRSARSFWSVGEKVEILTLVDDFPGLSGQIRATGATGPTGSSSLYLQSSPSIASHPPNNLQWPHRRYWPHRRPRHRILVTLLLLPEWQPYRYFWSRWSATLKPTTSSARSTRTRR